MPYEETGVVERSRRRGGPVSMAASTQSQDLAMEGSGCLTIKLV